MPPRLGELLVERGACSGGAVAEALQAQAVFGGRLGTNLLEAGALSEERLALTLGDRHHALALYGDLLPEPGALKLIAAGDADRWEVVPLRAFGRKLALLTLDPGNVAVLDEVAFATGRNIVPFVVPEARLWRLLVRCYRVFREERGIELPGRAPAPRGTPGAKPSADLIDEGEFDALYGRLGITTPLPFRSPLVAAPATGVPPPIPPASSSAPVPAGSGHPEVIPPLDLSGAFALLPELEPEPEPEPEAPLSFADAVLALEGVKERGAIAHTVLRYARSRFRRALLLTVRRSEIHGWEGLGPGVEVENVRRLRLPLGADGVLATVAGTQSHFLGPLPKNESNIRLLRALGGGVPKSAFVVPVLALGRAVNLLYADNGRGEQVDPDDLGELLILAARIAEGYDALARRAV